MCLINVCDVFRLIWQLIIIMAVVHKLWPSPATLSYLWSVDCSMSSQVISTHSYIKVSINLVNKFNSAPQCIALDSFHSTQISVFMSKQRRNYTLIWEIHVTDLLISWCMLSFSVHVNFQVILRLFLPVGEERGIIAHQNMWSGNPVIM
jgi:hypothetical protein